MRAREEQLLIGVLLIGSLATRGCTRDLHAVIPVNVTLIFGFLVGRNYSKVQFRIIIQASRTFQIYVILVGFAVRDPTFFTDVVRRIVVVAIVASDTFLGNRLVIRILNHCTISYGVY